MIIEPGNTPVIKSKIFSKLWGIPELYYKLEGINPTGTHKDRIASSICQYAKKEGFETVAVATCGNFGASIAYYAKVNSLICRVYIPENYHSTRLRDIIGVGASIHYLPGKYEDVVKKCGEISEQNGWFNASPNNKIVKTISFDQYGEIAKELVDQLKEINLISIPVGNGTTLAGIYYGFLKEFENGRIERIPTLIAASTIHGNPIVTSLNKELKQILILEPDLLKETEINEPLISYESFDGQEALDFLNSTKGYAFNLADSSMINASKQLYDFEGLSVLPASTSSLLAVNMCVKNNPSLKNKKIVCILTARGSVVPRVSNVSKVLMSLHEERPYKVGAKTPQEDNPAEIVAVTKLEGKKKQIMKVE